MSETERKPCPECGKEVTWTQAGKPRQHKCEPAQKVQEQPAQEQSQQAKGVTLDMVVKAYVSTRDTIAAINKKAKEDVAALKEVQEKRESYMRRQLELLGVESAKTVEGTVYVSWKDSATVENRENFLNWVKEDWETRETFIENRVSKSEVKTLLEDGNTPPPGIKYVRIKGVNVRRS